MRPGLGLALALALSLLLALPARAGGPATAYYAADTDGIFWFLHLSDIHVGAHDSIGEWYSQTDPSNIIWALDEPVTVIDPIFVVATGDLVNGSRNNIPTAGQNQHEWNDYKAIYQAAVAAHPTVPYYDVIGNHDMYSPRLPDECPSLHWYLDNSYRGQQEGAAHFSWTHTTPLGDYFFYGLNSTGDCVDAFTGGDGTLVDAEYNAIKAALEDNVASSQLMFVFAHQGPAQPQNSARVVDELVKHGVFFVHGHRHEYTEYLEGNSLGEVVVNEVDTIGKGNTNNLGVGVVDHNAFVYRATSREDPWPHVILTAPVAMRLRGSNDLNPWAYDVCKDRQNPFRALVFAPETPAPVTVILGTNAPVNMSPVAGKPNLWSAMVDTSGLAEGQQTIKVTATAGGKTRTHEVAVNFVAGPCDAFPQQDAGVPQQDAGGQQDGGGGGDGEAQEDGGGGEGDGGSPPPPPSDCGCRAAGEGTGPAGLGLLAVAGLGLLVRGRRRGR